MANAHPDALRARMLRKQKGKTGGLAEIKRKVWIALLHAEDILEQAGPEQTELRLRAVHAISQVAGQLSKLIEVGELEARLVRLEALAGVPKE